MTPPAGTHRFPGTTLRRIAPLLFSEAFIVAVVDPTIADLQAEFAAAGDNRARQLRARWRGYAAFWRVTLAAPFAALAPAPAAPSEVDAPAAPRRTGNLGTIAVIVAVLAVNRVFLGISFIVLAAAVLCAIVIHLWYERHPSDTAAPRDRSWRSPQINFSNMEVPGNIGGLIFMVGSLLVVLLGLPSVLWFLLIGAAAGSFVAWRLATWHARHPKWGLPENRIVLR